MSLQQKIISGSFWQVLNVGLFSVMNVVFLMVMARLIEKEVHGIFVVMHLLILILSMISKSGVYLALVRREHNSSRDVSFAFWISIILGSAFTILLFFVAPLIHKYYNNDISIFPMQVISIFFFLYSLGLVSEALIIRDLNFKSLFITKCGSYFVSNIVVGISLAYLGYGIWAFVIGFLLFTFLNSVSKYVLRPHSLRWNFGIEEINEVKHFAFGFTITELLNTSATYIDKLIIGKFVSLDLLAVFQKGQHTSRLPVSVFGSAFDNVLYAFFSNVHRRKMETKEIFLRLSSMIWIVAVSLIVFTYCYADQIIILILGRSWASSVEFFKLFALVTPLILVSKLSDAFLRAEDKLYTTAKVKMIYLILIVVASLTASVLELYEVSTALTLAYFAYVFIMVLTTLKYLKINYLVYLREIGPAIFVGLSLFLLNSILQIYLSIRLGYAFIIFLALLFHFVVFVLVVYYQPVLFGRKNLKFVVKASEANKILSILVPDRIRKHLTSKYEST